MLTREFYSHEPGYVARALLGKKLCRLVDGQLLAGLITEVEAYGGPEDSASHASKGQTPRNAVMFGKAGISYVYFIYGMHYMFNIVTEQKGRAAAVLIRALYPTNGIEKMIRNRNGQARHIADGPAKLCQALKIDFSINKHDLTNSKTLWLQSGINVSNIHINSGPRIGIDYAAEKDKNAPLRYWLSNVDLYI